MSHFTDFTDYLESAVYVPKIKCRDKKDLFHNIAYLMLENQGFSRDFIENVFNLFLYREVIGTTGCGGGCAIPHATWCGNFLQLGFFTVEPPIDYDSLDNQPVFFIGAILIPEQYFKTRQLTEKSLEVMATIAELMSDKSVISNIIQLETTDQLRSRIINWTPHI